jgi:hypothetical protein
MYKYQLLCPPVQSNSTQLVDTIVLLTFLHCSLDYLGPVTGQSIMLLAKQE